MNTAWPAGHVSDSKTLLHFLHQRGSITAVVAKRPARGGGVAFAVVCVSVSCLPTQFLAFFDRLCPCTAHDQARPPRHTTRDLWLSQSWLSQRQEDRYRHPDVYK